MVFPALLPFRCSYYHNHSVITEFSSLFHSLKRCEWRSMNDWFEDQDCNQGVEEEEERIASEASHDREQILIAYFPFERGDDWNPLCQLKRLHTMVTTTSAIRMSLPSDSSQSVYAFQISRNSWRSWWKLEWHQDSQSDGKSTPDHRHDDKTTNGSEEHSILSAENLLILEYNSWLCICLSGGLERLTTITNI